MSDRIDVNCSIEKIRFFKNHWGIIETSVDQINKGAPRCGKWGYLTFKGEMPDVREGSSYRIVGEFVDDPKWGPQYNIIRMYSNVVFKDNDKESQHKFLESIFTPRQVKLLYDELEDPFLTLKNKDMKSLVQVKGIGMYTAVEMTTKFDANFHLGKIFSELSEYNLTNNMINKLMMRYKSPDIVIDKVKRNPYVLVDEVEGIGWAKADQIAQAGGIGLYDVRRIGAYMKQYLRVVGEEGQSWVTPDELLGAVLDNLGEDVPDEKITESIQAISEDLWWNEDKTQIGLKKYYLVEKRIAEELIRIRDAESDENHYTDWLDTIHALEVKQGWKFTSEQLEGIKLAITSNVILITGMAGTGKSSLVKGILEVLKDKKFVQCALSGRAAARMGEITGQDGSTIHRLLGYPNFDQGSKHGFVFHEDNPLDYDLYIVDEISMIGTSLFLSLLRAIPSGAKLICLGDHGQLESIGAGNIAHDIMASPEIPTVVLHQIHRQAQASGIISEAFKIRSGQQIVEKDWVGEEIRGDLKDFKLICYSDASNTFYNIMAAYSAARAEKNFNILDVQIIVPVKTKGMACTYELNNAIQEIANPVSNKKNEVTVYNYGKPYLLREGDKIINIKNNYRTKPVIYNGNIGVIKTIDEANDLIIADFIGIGEVEIDSEFWDNLELGYAITGHKFQGSQCKEIIVGMDYSGYLLLSREWCYTAITRAEEKCTFIAQTSALRYATANEAVSKKQTHLQQALYDVAHPKLVF